MVVHIRTDGFVSLFVIIQYNTVDQRWCVRCECIRKGLLSDLAVGGITEQLPLRVLHGTGDRAVHKAGHSQLRHVQFTLQRCVLDQRETGRSGAKTEPLGMAMISYRFYIYVHLRTGLNETLKIDSIILQCSDGFHHHNLNRVLAELNMNEPKNWLSCHVSFVLSITNSKGCEGCLRSKSQKHTSSKELTLYWIDCVKQKESHFYNYSNSNQFLSMYKRCNF